VDRSRGQFLPNRKRGFAIEKTAALCPWINNRVGILCCVEHALVGRSYTRTAVDQSVTRKLTVIKVERQRYLLLIEGITRLECDFFSECKTEAQIGADCLAVVRDIARRQILTRKYIYAARHTIAEQKRLNVRQVKAASTLSISD